MNKSDTAVLLSASHLTTPGNDASRCPAKLVIDFDCAYYLSEVIRVSVTEAGFILQYLDRAGFEIRRKKDEY